MNRKCSNCAANENKYDDWCLSMCKYGKQIKDLKAENEEIRQNSVTHETHRVLVAQARKEAAKQILDELIKPITVYLETYNIKEEEQRQIGANLAKAKMDERLKKVIKDFDIEAECEITEECEICGDDLFDAYVPVGKEGDYMDKPCEPGEEWVYHAKYCPNCGRKL